MVNVETNKPEFCLETDSQLQVLRVLYGSGRPENANGPFSRELLNEMSKEASTLCEGPVYREIQSSEGRLRLSCIKLTASYLFIAQKSVYPLQESLDFISRIVRKIGHDFNNHLTAVCGNVSLLKFSSADPETLKFAAKAEKSCLRFGRNITDLKMLADRGQPGITEDPSGEISALINDFGEIKRKEIQCRLSLDGSDWVVDMPKDEFRRMIYEFIRNSLDASRRNNISDASLEIVLSVLPGKKIGKNNMKITISDNCGGIPEEILSDIFDPRCFYSPEDSGKILGFGLTYAYNIAVVRNEGKLIVFNNTDGGVSAEMLLPGRRPVPHTERSSRDSAALKQQSKGKRILVADDERSVREFIEETLSRDGYSVTAAESGIEAFEKFKAGKDDFDAAVIDIVMPELDGSELMRKIKKSGSKCRILVSTGFFDKCRAKDIIENSDEILIKPYRASDLKDALERILQNR
ncbi:MAG: hybrid sensor histidine kinase/response regulator [Fibrobacterota bacterium]